MNAVPPQLPPSDPPQSPSSPSRRGREALGWALGMVATLALAAIAAVGGMVLATFGLGGVVLALAAMVLVVSATVWRRAALPAAVVATALALPAAEAALSSTRLDRSHGTLTVRPSSPDDLSDHTYRRGTGTVFVDLRGYHAPRGSRTGIAAQADSGRVVVALPRDRCFHLNVQYRVDPYDARREAVLQSLGVVGLANDPWRNVGFGSVGLTEAAWEAEHRGIDQAGIDGSRLPYNLLAFGRAPSTAGVWMRPVVGDASAPTLDLVLDASQQIVVRDYPDWAGPLDFEAGDDVDQIAGTRWPEGLKSPPSPGERAWALRSSVRTPANRARWVSWEREITAWGKAQANRFAGPCASRAERRERAITFLTQPERFRVDGGSASPVLLGGPTTRRSAIEQPVVRARETMLQVEVNGLGETRVVGTRALVSPADHEETR